MSCLMLFLLTMVIMYFGAVIAFFLAVGMVPLAILSLILIPLAILFTWRIIYPWLVRMGRWSAQLRNILFLALVLTVVGVGLGYIIDIPIVPLPLIGEVPVTFLVFVPLFLFLLLLGIVVWLVRLWRYSWPLLRNLFWDLLFRFVALLWKILVGIPIGIVWFFYHPPLRWLVAALVFYLRGIAAGVAWFLYNPPLRSIAMAVLFVTRLIGRVVAAILYNPPIRWLIQFGLFTLRLIARFISTVIYGIVSWWLVKGVKGVLGKGLTVESKSYQDYSYAQDDNSGTT
jgi:hypothetical protein